MSQVGWFQAGGTFQWQGSVVLWFVVETQNPAPATHYYNYHYMASVCFGQPNRHNFMCCDRGMAAVFGMFLAISIHRIE